MIAYNKELLLGLHYLNSAKELKDAGFITKAQYQAVNEKPRSLHSQRNWLMRICFGFLGFLLYGAILSAISLIGMSAIDQQFEIIVFTYALVGLVMTEVLAHSGYYQYGLDDISVWGFQAFFAGGIFMVTDSNLALFATMTILGAICGYRYVNTVSILASLVGITGFVSTVVLDSGIITPFALPFVLLVVAIGILFLARKASLFKKIAIFSDVVFAIFSFGFVLLYLSCNYLVVRESAAELMNYSPKENESFPFSWFFYFFMFVVPIAYIAFAAKTANRALLWIGLVAFGFSIFSIRFYHHFFPTEWALMLGGSVLFGLSYFAFSKLKGREKGLTYEKDRFTRSQAFIVAESLIANAQTNPSMPAQRNEMTFGGGDFSGGGSSGNF